MLKIDKSKLDPDDLLSVEDFMNERLSLGDWKHERQSTGMMAASVTSSNIQIQASDELRKLNKSEMLIDVWNRVKTIGAKSYV